jgi:hypothetical protein
MTRFEKHLNDQKTIIVLNVVKVGGRRTFMVVPYSSNFVNNLERKFLHIQKEECFEYSITKPKMAAPMNPATAEGEVATAEPENEGLGFVADINENELLLQTSSIHEADILESKHQAYSFISGLFAEWKQRQVTPESKILLPNDPQISLPPENKIIV